MYDHITDLTDLRNAWAEDSNRLEGQQWNDAFVSFGERMDDLLRLAGGHPTGVKPRPRPS